MTFNVDFLEDNILNPENLEIQMALVNVITHKGNRGR